MLRGLGGRYTRDVVSRGPLPPHAKLAKNVFCSHALRTLRQVRCGIIVAMLKGSRPGAVMIFRGEVPA